MMVVVPLSFGAAALEGGDCEQGRVGHGGGVAGEDGLVLEGCRIGRPKLPALALPGQTFEATASMRKLQSLLLRLKAAPVPTQGSDMASSRIVGTNCPPCVANAGLMLPMRVPLPREERPISALVDMGATLGRHHSLDDDEGNDEVVNVGTFAAPFACLLAPLRALTRALLDGWPHPPASLLPVLPCSRKQFPSAPASLTV